jgi:hypothetical protein
MFASLTLASQIAMRGVPGVQTVGVFVAVMTLVYRKRALIPIYVFVLLFLLYYGFLPWNLPYLYIWLPLWGAFMLAGSRPLRRLSAKPRMLLYMSLCGLYGLSFGVLYAPSWALANNLNLAQITAWVIAGLPTDITHAVNNLAMGVMIAPLSDLLRLLQKRS